MHFIVESQYALYGGKQVYLTQYRGIKLACTVRPPRDHAKTWSPSNAQTDFGLAKLHACDRKFVYVSLYLCVCLFVYMEYC
jgi:hypothetical protein